MDVTQTLKPRPICTQYGESDLDFLTRLLASEGLSWRFEHEQTPPAGANTHAATNAANACGAPTTSAQARHCLVIFDAATSLNQ